MNEQHNPYPIYEVLHRRDEGVTSQRIHFKDQGQANEANRKIMQAGASPRCILDTRYGSAVIDITPGVFLGLYPLFSNAPVDQVTYRADDETTAQGKYQGKRDLSDGVLEQTGDDDPSDEELAAQWDAAGGVTDAQARSM